MHCITSSIINIITVYMDYFSYGAIIYIFLAVFLVIFVLKIIRTCLFTKYVKRKKNFIQKKWKFDQTLTEAIQLILFGVCLIILGTKKICYDCQEKRKFLLIFAAVFILIAAINQIMSLSNYKHKKENWLWIILI